MRYLIGEMKPAQRYLLAHRSELKERISENTLNSALRWMGYEDQLTGHGIRGTLSTALWLMTRNWPKLRLQRRSAMCLLRVVYRFLSARGIRALHFSAYLRCPSCRLRWHRSRRCRRSSASARRC